MKRLIALILLLNSLLLCGCNSIETKSDIVTTTLPVYEFTAALCQGTDITVCRLITENVSCLHDYTLQSSQAKALEQADTVVISGLGLEGFLQDALPQGKAVIDASGCPDTETHHEHDHAGHDHSTDPHIWLSVPKAKEMCQNICQGLKDAYPGYTDTFVANLDALLKQMEQLDAYGHEMLDGLESTSIITFHDGFGHLAESYGLTVLKAIEEESGSEASAKELIEIIRLIEANNLKAIFTEKNGSTSAAGIISAEVGVPVYALDMAMSGDSWFEAMYHNIDTLKEALE